MKSMCGIYKHKIIVYQIQHNVVLSLHQNGVVRFGFWESIVLRLFFPSFHE